VRANEKIRLGGMALGNGVLVHGPGFWACAVRLESGEIKVASGEKPVQSSATGNRLVRGPLRLAEVLALLPVVRRGLPEAQLPFERPGVAGALVGSAVAIRAVRESRLPAFTREAIAAVLAVLPAAAALRRSSLAEYHGAEHISIGTYEHDEPRAREHERCGSHVLGPLLVTSAAGSVIAGRAPVNLRPLARLAAGVGALAASTEIFAWMVANDRHPVARALARPGHELQNRLVTAEPTPEQLEVANAALHECLRLELAANDGADQDPEEAPSA
jgi:uncharacterized protein YqhQ